MTWNDIGRIVKPQLAALVASEPWVIQENTYAHSASTIVVWLLFWNLRHYDDPTRLSDLWLFGGVQLYHVTRSKRHFTKLFLLLKSLGTTLGLLLIVGLVVLSILALSRYPNSKKPKAWPPVKCTQPLFHRCRTTHSRMFPTPHSFSYSYLQVSVPVVFQRSRGRIFSIGQGQRWSLFRIDPLDYLERHCEMTSLEGRLGSYLESQVCSEITATLRIHLSLNQNVNKKQWSHAYLVTAPKFLGYSFNPVSFWYIFDENDRLAMMVLEVNNTFDERRMYLLKNGVDASQAEESLAKFRKNWGKDFHVSPFNSRKGAYSLTAVNPFNAEHFKAPGIDSTIVLSSSKKHSKLVARLYSESPPIEADSISLQQLLTLALQWGWQGFFTFPRILKEASLLFFRRKLHVWLRPEVTASSVGRAATDLER
jgi:DUF1365 family protein